MSVRTASRIVAFLVASLCFGTLQGKAQDLSPEADQAFWCAAAYANYVKKAAFISPEQQTAAFADVSRLEGALAADAARLGWRQSDVEALALSYNEEVGPQVDDYLLWKDPAALRLNLADCFPSAGFQVVLLVVRYGAKRFEFEKGKEATMPKAMAELVAVLPKLIAATEGGDTAQMITGGYGSVRTLFHLQGSLGFPPYVS